MTMCTPPRGQSSQRIAHGGSRATRLTVAGPMRAASMTSAKRSMKRSGSVHGQSVCQAVVRHAGWQRRRASYSAAGDRRRPGTPTTFGSSSASRWGDRPRRSDMDDRTQIVELRTWPTRDRHSTLTQMLRQELRPESFPQMSVLVAVELQAESGAFDRPGGDVASDRCSESGGGHTCCA